jgi:hypothetical protein
MLQLVVALMLIALGCELLYARNEWWGSQFEFGSTYSKTDKTLIWSGHGLQPLKLKQKKQGKF